MKLSKLIREWRTTGDASLGPTIPHDGNVQSKRLALYEMVTAGIADDPASFIIEEIERLGDSIGREL
ncbi:hypothetical protein [Rhizobium terrae]|uniref:hypothetical protein n=1 Tax=Rhizobium terrae TaxID=2171756 RepID=UPI000E3E457D|nr:hypothetical protein [Rhizobium terrae]